MKLKRFKNALILAFACVGLILSNRPVPALQAQIIPQNPQQGDTISVMLLSSESEKVPQVVVGKRKYPAFLLHENSYIYRAFIPTTPLMGPGKLTIKIISEGKAKNLAVSLKDRAFPTQRLWLSPKKGGLTATKIELEKVAAFKKIVTPEKYWQGKFIAPNKGEVSTVFGVRRYYNGVLAEDYYHAGVDYAGAYGSPIVAPASGKIALVGLESAGFRIHGNTIGIDHGQGVLSIFLHLSRIDVQEGDFVQIGQKIGNIGSTGASTGPHLHWGLYVNGLAVDPVPWRYEGIE